MSRTQIKPILAPRGGLRMNLPGDLISPLEMTDCANVFFEDGLIKKRFGYKKMGGNLPLSGAIVGSDQFYLFGGGNFLLMMTTKDVYKWNVNNKMWELLTPSTLLHACDLIWSDGEDTAVLDTADEVEGTACAKITLGAERKDSDKLIYKDITADISGHEYIGFWIKSSIALAAGALEVVVSETSAVTDPKANSYCEIETPALTADTWTFVRVHEDDDEITWNNAAGKQGDMNAVLSVSLYANATIASATIIRIDDIRAYTPYTGEDSDLFSFDYIRKSAETEPWWICTNGVDKVQYWDGDAACLADLAGSPPLAKRLVAFKDHLHLLDVDSGTRFPQRIHWSDTGDPTNWTTGNSSYQDLPGADWISNGMTFKGDYLVVLKERSIEVGYATGDTEIFEFDCKVTGAGCAAPNTIESLGDEIIFLGWDDVYVFNGIDYEPIGTPIQRELFRTLNPEQIGRCFGVVIEEQKEYWLFVPSTTSTYPNMAWCFNYDLNKWTKHSFGDYITAFGYYFLQAAKTWDDLTGTWQQQDFRWDDRTILKHAPTTVFGDKDGYVYEYNRLTHNDDDTAIDAYFDTKDFNFTQLTQRQRILRLDIYYTGLSLAVSYSTDKGKTWTAIGTLGASDDLETPRSLYLRLDCNMVRFKFRNTEDNQHFEFSRANIHWQQAGGRLG